MAILPLFMLSCRARPAEVANTNTNAPTPTSLQTDSPVQDLQKPYLIENNPALHKAWQGFTKDGHYRLARLSDMKFSESNIQPLPYWQSTEVQNDAGIAAIIIDTHEPQGSQFGIVVFKYEGGSGDKERYSTYWLCKGTDLSRMGLHRASGYVFLDTYKEDGTRKTCSVPWSYRKHRYVL
ncbi:MAG TPA: hypothetical protein VJ843_00445, partial [Candidatus Saccharimonadales bacterium]|nr:hypothetical protein [Candidatus Saccharimonadales bacterium]